MSAMDKPKPITERKNPLTNRLDFLSPSEILDVLHRVDGEIYNGWQGFPGLRDTAVIESIAALAAGFQWAFQTPEAVPSRGVVFAGCGTSGRIAYLCATAFNNVLSARGLPGLCRYILAGGDDAIVLSIEQPEDNPFLGRDSLVSVMQRNNFSDALVVGITCGLSAPFVAGIVDYALTTTDEFKFQVAVIGFNPPPLARDRSVPNWEKTCRQVFLHVSETWEHWRSGDKDTPPRAISITPVVGPEPITGSSRMKGGSATKAILDVAFFLALQPTMEAEKKREYISSSLTALYNGTLSAYSTDVRSFLASVVKTTASAVRRGGHVVYVGLDAMAGRVGVMDISEMVDTYGSREDEWRCVVQGGWSSLQNAEGDISSHHPLLRIGIDELQNILQAGDVVVNLASAPLNETGHRLLAEVEALSSKKHARCFSILMGKPSIPISVTETMCFIPMRDGEQRLELNEYDAESVTALKLITNLISTVTQVVRGSVLGNQMINITVSNDKLFHRAVHMIVELTCSDQRRVESALARAISDDVQVEYQTDGAMSPECVTRFVLLAEKLRFVVPVALLLVMHRAKSRVEALKLIGNAESLQEVLQLDPLNAVSVQPPFRVRNATPKDLSGAYYICLKTGNYGADGEPYYRDDPEALGRIYVGPYIVLQPDYALVLEDTQGKICGYALGTPDTKKFFDRYETIWRPRLAASFEPPTGDSVQWTRADAVHNSYHHPDYYIVPQYETYPAHMHIDLLEEARGKGIGRKMLEEVMSRLRANGIPGVHLGVSINNESAMAFYRKLGFSEICRVGVIPDGTVYMGKTL
jgi:N-acetylmuramic acid 6-phosphate (MurNAc-6-P) etherase/ribosomal protein S18 acetylase RimI-like enzyme